jgi:hypothetical protein
MLTEIQLFANAFLASVADISLDVVILAGMVIAATCGDRKRSSDPPQSSPGSKTPSPAAMRCRRASAPSWLAA